LPVLTATVFGLFSLAVDVAVGGVNKRLHTEDSCNYWLFITSGRHFYTSSDNYLCYVEADFVEQFALC